MTKVYVYPKAFCEENEGFMGEKGHSMGHFGEYGTLWGEWRKYLPLISFMPDCGGYTRAAYRQQLESQQLAAAVKICPKTAPFANR